MDELKIPTREEVIKRLQKLPGAINSRESSFLDSKYEYEEKLERQIQIKNATMSEVEAETEETINDKGDVKVAVKFSNDTKRRLEVERRLKENKDYLIIDARIRELKKTMDFLSIEIDHIKRSFRADEVTGLLLTSR